MLTHNGLWRAVFGPIPAGWAGNVVWTAFAEPRPEVLAGPEEHERVQRSLVADLRHTMVRYPHDSFLRQLVADLLESSPVFAAMWVDRAAMTFAVDVKTVVHPEVGPITLGCDVLTSIDNDLRIVVHTPPPGSESAEKLRLLNSANRDARDDAPTGAHRA